MIAQGKHKRGDGEVREHHRDTMANAKIQVVVERAVLQNQLHPRNSAIPDVRRNRRTQGPSLQMARDQAGIESDPESRFGQPIPKVDVFHRRSLESLVEPSNSLKGTASDSSEPGPKRRG